MNAHDVISALFNGAPARFGLYENVWPDTLLAWEQEGYPAGSDPVEVFGYDLGRIGAAFDAQPRLGGARILEETDDWVIQEDGSGAVTKRFKHRSVTPGHIRWEMTDQAVWAERFRPLLEQTDDARIPVEALKAALAKRKAQGLWTCFNMSFIWENFRQAVGDICMYESLLDDPAWIQEYNAVQLSFYKRHIDRALALVGTPDGIWFSEDLAYNQGLFCSPKVLETLYMPVYAALNAYLHQQGLRVILHSCGRVERALPMLIEAGFDALHPMQVHAGCDPLAIARQYKDRLVLLGGLDCHLIETNQREPIREAQTHLMRSLQDMGTRYIFSSDHSLSTNVRYDTYRSILDTFHNLADKG